MEVKTQDRYMIHHPDHFNAELLSSLFLLYQPMMGRSAVSLYMTLYAQGQTEYAGAYTHERLLMLTDMDISEFEKSRLKLEEFMLLHIYLKKGLDHSDYIYRLTPPLSASMFFRNTKMSGRLSEVLGSEDTRRLAGMLLKSAEIPAGYEEIRRVVPETSFHSTLNLNVEYNQVKPKYKFVGEDESIHFDYDRFLRIVTPLTYPTELRTEPYMALIGRLATVHGISPDRMAIFVTRCTNPDTKLFDEQKLKALCQKASPDVEKKGDLYDLSPVSFLQSKQNGVPVTPVESGILEHLAEDFRFEPAVINILIETVLKKSGNQLRASFVDMIAGEWARDGVKTKADAFAAAKKSDTPQAKKTGRRKMPAYFNQTPKEADQTPASADDLKEIEEMLKQMEG